MGLTAKVCFVSLGRAQASRLNTSIVVGFKLALAASRA